MAAESVAGYKAAMDVHALHDGAAAAFRLVSAANNYIAETQPWALAKDPANAERLNGVLAETAEAVRIAAVLLSPVMPASATEILRRLGDSAPASRTAIGHGYGLAHVRREADSKRRRPVAAH